MPLPRKSAKAQKSPNQTPRPGQLVPQPNGRGAIRHGSLPGNTPGTGRPKDEVREKLIGLANGKGMDFLNKLLDGRVALRLVGTCNHCGKEGRALTTPETEAFLDAVRASVDQRLKGLDMALRYGPGTKDELDVRSHPDVQRFISVHAQATREIAGDELYLRIAERVQELAA